jgi:hypothetical protein
MKLPEPNGGGNFEQVPAGNHVAICYRIVDLGTQSRKAYQGQEKVPCRKVSIGWELPGKKMTQGEQAGLPFTFYDTFNVFTNQNAGFRQLLEAWRGQPYLDDEITHVELSDFIGMPCLLNLTHKASENGKTYTNLTSIAPLPDGFPAPDMFNTPVYFDLDEFDPILYAGFSEKLQKWIAESPEFKEATGQKVGAGVGKPATSGPVTVGSINDDEDVPF